MKVELEKERMALKHEVAMETARNSHNHADDTFNRTAGGSRRAPVPKLPTFNCGRDDLDAYLNRFERFAEAQHWPEEEWATSLSALLTGRALEAFNSMSVEHASSYPALKALLQVRYQLTEEGFRNQFFDSKPRMDEPAEEFMTRLKTYLAKWMSLGKIPTTYEALKDLVVREQFMKAVDKDLYMYLREKTISTSQQMVDFAARYMQVHHSSLGTKKSFNVSSSNANRVSNPSPKPGETKAQVQCKKCLQYGHATERCTRSVVCHFCHKAGHFKEKCYSFLKTQQQTGKMNTSSRAGAAFGYPDTPGMGPINPGYFDGPPAMQVGNPPVFVNAPVRCQHVSGCACIDHRPAMQSGPYQVSTERAAGCVLHMLGEVDNCVQSGKLTLACGRELPIISGACGNDIHHVTTNRDMPVQYGKIGTKRVSTLRDTGCSGVVVRSSFVLPEQYTGKSHICILIDGSSKKVPMARIHIDTPYYVGMVDAMCMEAPIYDLIVGNVKGARDPHSPNPSWEFPDVGQGIVTRAQAKKDACPIKPLVVPEALDIASSVDELRKEQAEDLSLRKAWDKAVSDEPPRYLKSGLVWFEVRKKLLYRRYKPNGVEANQAKNQIVVPKGRRQKVLKLAHESAMGGHLSASKTTARILTNFYWPDIQGDVTRFCRSCDTCQRTVPKGRSGKGLLEQLPIIDTPFKRVAVDLVGPIFPVSDRKHRWKDRPIWMSTSVRTCL